MRDTGETMQRGRVGGMSIDASPEWRDWLRRLAARERSKSAPLLDRLAAEHAARVGFDPPPERCGR